MAIIAILTATTLAIFDPYRKSKQARDASRKSSLAQIAAGLVNYTTIKNSYPEKLADLVPGELKNLPKNPDGNDFSYLAQASDGGVCLTENKSCQKAVVYGEYEIPKTLCSSGSTYWGWTSSSLRLGKICSNSPSPDETPIDDL